MDEEWNDEELVEKIFVDNPPYDIEELTKEEILSDMVMDYLVSIKNPVDRIYTLRKCQMRKIRICKALNTTFSHIRY